MSDKPTDTERQRTARDETVHDEHPVEPAEGAPNPGEDAETDVREHPSEPAEGRPDVGR
ncbi:MAG TPA: hypothetical protein VKB09_08490 [Thermomicrobiales bacterium]|nr:hypothetical protein [Thermomicrobiales bacterium]